MTANHLAIRRALVRQFDLEDKRREINRELCGVRAGIRNLLGVGTRTRKGRRAGKRGGEEQHNRMHQMNATIRAKSPGRKRNGKGAGK